MVSLPSFDTGSATPALRRPVFEVAFGSGDSGGGGLASALGGALGVDLGGAADQWKQSVASIAIDAGLAPSVDAVTIHLSAGETSPPVALDDEGSVSLGYEDGSTELAFTGKIDSLRHSIVGATSITAANGGVRLSRLRVNQSYEKQTAGDIVKDLAGRVEVETDSVEDGVDLPFYVIDDRRNAYQHIAALARKSGYLAFFTPESKLNFMPFVAGEPLQKFKYGEDILSLEVTDAAQMMGEVKITGEGAAGSKGGDAWSWLVKDPSFDQGERRRRPPPARISGRFATQRRRGAKRCGRPRQRRPDDEGCREDDCARSGCGRGRRRCRNNKCSAGLYERAVFGAQGAPQFL